MKTTRVFICAMAMFCATALSANEGAKRETFTFSYFKEMVELESDSNEIAILLDDHSPSSAVEEILDDKDDLSIRSEFQLGEKWLVVKPKNKVCQKSLRESVKAKLKSPYAKFSTPVFRNAKGERTWIAPRLMIGFENDATEAQIANVLSRIAAKRESKKVSRRPRYQVELSLKDGIDTLDLANSLIALDGVKYCHPDLGFIGQTAYIPADPLYPSAWHLNNIGQSGGLVGFDIGAKIAWDITRGTSSVKVAILDSGVETNHPDFSGKISDVKNFTNEGSTTDVSPRNIFENHGTAVAGCTTAGMNNAVGSTAIAPDVRLAIARIGMNYSSTGNFTSYTSWITNAIYWAQTIGASVTNFSNEMPIEASDIATAYNDTREGVNLSVQTNAYVATAPKGLVHFASSGNGFPSPIVFPARLASVNAVGSVNRFGQRASYSQVGAELDLVAPGEEIVSVDRVGLPGYGSVSGNQDFCFFGGTSAASPVAAGVAALIASRYPNWTAQQIENQIRRFTQRTGGDLTNLSWPNNTFGNGLVRADLALQGQSWQLFSVSNRSFSQSGSEVTVMGFFISGTQAKKVLLRGVGPELTQFGVSGVMSDPKIVVYDASGNTVASNDNWNSVSNSSETRATTESVGAFSLIEASNSASLVLTLNPGAYTMHIIPSTGAAGVALAEVYDADASFNSRFMALSTRGKVQTGSGILIGGLGIQGTGPRRVLLRGIGPALTGFGVPGALADPTLTLFRHNQDGTATAVTSNDDWSTNSNTSEIITISQLVGAFSLTAGSKDAVLLVLLEPGLYSAHVNGKNGSTGIGLVEAYAVDPQ
jgi:subtilisin family serine protease